MSTALQDQLIDAVWSENISRIKQLLDSGADVNTAGSKGWTPLTQAAEAGNLSITRMLLDKGADVNGRAHQGCTPLHLAVDVAIERVIQTGGQPGDERTELIQLLLDRGASLLATDDAGRTPLSWAARSRKLRDFLKPWFEKQKSSTNEGA